MQEQINSTNGHPSAKFWRRFTHWLSQAGDSQQPTQFEWNVVSYGVGIGIYFALPFEPPLVWLSLLVVGLAWMLFVLRRYVAPLKSLAFLGVLVLLGVGRSAWHSQASMAAQLPEYERSYQVTGWVSAVEKSGPRLRWRIEVLDME